jgi:hypothetical protein
MATGVARSFGFAAKLRGQPDPVSTWFELEDKPPYSHFGFLLKAIEHMIHSGRPAYPVERTLLTTGALDAAMHSLNENGSRRPTPELAIRYQPADWPFAE